MTLAAIVSDINDVPAALREHYIERNGKFHLDTEGDEGKVRLNRDLADERKKRQALERDLQAHRQELEDLRAKRGKSDDDEDTTSDRRLAKLRIEMDELRRSSDAATREKDAEAARLKSELTRERIGARIRSTASGKVVSTAIEDVVNAGMAIFREDESGKYAAFDVYGERLLGKSGEDLGFDEWVEQRRTDRPHWFGNAGGSGNQGGGAGHQGSGQSGQRPRPKKRSEMTPQEKAAAISELGSDGYLALPY